MNKKKSNYAFQILNDCQPVPNFWKDEGGKRNTLNVTIKFNNNNLKINIPLILSIYFENKEKVNDQSIFIITNDKGEDIKKKKIEYKYKNNLNGQEIRFRINKVSRRFDNKKFIVKIEVDKSICPNSYFEIEPIYTNPIFVQSKRKIPACERDKHSHYNRQIKKKRYINIKSEIEYENKKEYLIKKLKNEINIIRKKNTELKKKISMLNKKVNESNKKTEINYIYNYYGDTNQNLYKYNINENLENEYDNYDSPFIPLGSLLYNKNEINYDINLINWEDINPIFIKE